MESEACKHPSIDVLTMCCATCGMTLEKIRRNHLVLTAPDPGWTEPAQPSRVIIRDASRLPFDTSE